ncbi:MAG: spermidine/putrescine ABC transporter permease PotC [Desulfovibrio sp.]|jgi:spermidine/putrescine transport system permease protein|nr:spermidine/putrescine ABC transporter permease PotC [Desulfovibrio sp.]
MMPRARLVRFFSAGYLTLIYAFFYVPLFIVFCHSFNYSKYVSDWNGFSLRWYESLLSNTAILDAALNSLLVGVCAASLGTLTGTLTALAIKRYYFFGRKSLYVAVLMLTVLPDLVMGISLLIVFIALHMELGFFTLLLAHTTLCAPFVTLTVLARLAEFDEYLVEAARDLGASESRAFLHVLLPLTAPAVAAGWLLSFTLSMDDVLISTFTTGPTFEVLPIKIYSMVKLGIKPDINALSTIMFAMTLTLVLLAQAITRIRRK